MSNNVIEFKIPEKTEPQCKKIPWNMSKQIKVGKRSDGYTIMQALEPLFNMGFNLTINKGENEFLCVTLANKQGKVQRTGEGSSFSVALRRMTVGMSNQYSHMIE